MIFFNNLPEEINDKIFLAMDWYELEKIREIQSDYVKQTTRYRMIYNAMPHINLNNIRWIYGNFNDNRYFHKLAPSISYDIFEYVARYGNLEIMKFLAKEGCVWNEKTLKSAIFSENLDCIKWLLKNGSLWNEWSFGHIAETGNLDNMKWLFKNGYSWNDYTFAMALMYGNLVNIKWLFDNGCPYLTYDFEYLYKEDVKLWIKENMVLTLNLV